MKTANELKELRDKELEKFNSRKNLIDGQWKYIEGKVDQFKITKDTKYIDITNVGELYKENEKKLISEPNCFYITKDKNGTRLYFDEKDYNHYVNSNKVKITDNKDVKEAIRECSEKYGKVLKKLNDDNSEKKTDLKNNLNKQDKDNKVEAKEYDTFEELATDIWSNIFNKYNL